MTLLIKMNLSQKDFKGFNSFNVCGTDVTIHQLAEQIVSIIGKGSVIVEDIPEQIKAIDIGNAEYSEVKLNEYLDQRLLTDFNTSLDITIKYFKERINALEM